jgi:multidrug efflux pump subunit AcrA (membrane-fusion protein)
MVRTAELRARWDRQRARYQADVSLEARLRRARFRLEAAKVERAWAVVSAQRDGLSVRKIAEAIGLSATRVHQILASPEAATFEARLALLGCTAGRHPRTRLPTPRRATPSLTAWATRPKPSGT